MQFTTAAIAAILSASSVFAAPAAIPNWTITGMNRVCNAADTSCTWSFGINTNTGAAVTPCSFVITGSPASHSDTSGMKACGTFSTTAGWSGQFGPGFTTLAVHNNANGQIAWPAYTDAELAGGKVVSPDKSWAVTQL
ncbi:hypothetical protein F4824DRAFT_470609 [Ustulina deusta]|nr:hypothetical protein F4823DRAFT_90967 [Ustulina deusta]KAI3333728.1 hypothetical protein F4824DRAFT_470609 [Ustulina deusta]